MTPLVTSPTLRSALRHTIRFAAAGKRCAPRDFEALSHFERSRRRYPSNAGLSDEELCPLPGACDSNGRTESACPTGDGECVWLGGWRTQRNAQLASLKKKLKKAKGNKKRRKVLRRRLGWTYRQYAGCAQNAGCQVRFLSLAVCANDRTLTFSRAPRDVPITVVQCAIKPWRAIGSKARDAFTNRPTHRPQDRRWLPLRKPKHESFFFLFFIVQAMMR